MRIAMWSGPRNLSTAMMYSFAARDDCRVVDEPFYAAYLARTGVEHPMRDEILASQPQEYGDVIAGLAKGGSGLQYEKHMTQHMVPGVDRGWLRDVRNVFLIRHPARVIASYAAKREDPSLEDIGFVQQAELFDLADDPIVIDSHDIREDPSGMLQKLCAALGIGFQPAMLRWEPGGRPEDGVWAAHWYGAVHRSAGFAGPEGELPVLDGAHAELVDSAMPYYKKLNNFRIL